MMSSLVIDRHVGVLSVSAKIYKDPPYRRPTTHSVPHSYLVHPYFHSLPTLGSAVVGRASQYGHLPSSLTICFALDRSAECEHHLCWITYIWSISDTVFISNNMSADTTEQQRVNYVKNYLAAAKECESVYKVPHMISLAQGALESAWGTIAGGYNFFGIKADTSWLKAGGKVVLQDTTEFISGKKVLFTEANDPNGKYRSFRSYRSAAEAFDDHAKFLVNNKRYAPCFKLAITDIAGWCKGLKACGYSTSPTYDRLLMDVVASVKKRLPR